MGKNDWMMGVAAIAAVGIGGVVVFSIPSIREQIMGLFQFPIVDPLEPEPTDPTLPPVDPAEGALGGKNCGALCRAKNCDAYKLNCKTGCVYCCGSGPNSKPCSSSGSSQCKSWCTAANCVEYRKNCTKGCSKCDIATSGVPSDTKCTNTCPPGYERGVNCACKAKSGASQQEFEGFYSTRAWKASVW